MNRAERLFVILQRHGGKATLGTILDEVREDGGLAYKFTASVSELRKQLEAENLPRTVLCERGKTASLNTYEIVQAERVDGKIVIQKRKEEKK